MSLANRLSILPGALLALLCAECGEDPPPWVEEREPCSSRDPLGQLYWGDLHVHTSWSFDAYVNQVRVDPAQALAFAKGDPVQIPPVDAGEVGTQTVQLDRPLDFVGITDHAEYLAEVQGCTDPDSPIYEGEWCQGYRDPERAAEFMTRLGLPLGNEDPQRLNSLCGGALDCPAVARDTWKRMVEINEAAYDKSEACTFTSFVAYEWSGLRDLSNLHRNVIFKSSQVPARPLSHFEAPRPEDLWRGLELECNQELDGCEALSIPHNGNWSNGQLFDPDSAEGDPVAWARLRAKIEPLVEVYQHKGDSECDIGPQGPGGPLLGGILGATDEACGFEKLREAPYEDCGEGIGSGALVNQGCISKRDFLRGTLLAGLQERERIGVNPFPVGVIASTDTHNGTPGAVNERTYAGHFGNREQGPLERLTAPIPGGPNNSPGGLVAVWAPENTRASIFEALARRESYGTSGPRIAVRFFGAWDLPQGLCEDPDLVAKADEAGVPMGGELKEIDRPDGARPHFVVLAEMDEGTGDYPGTPLERIELVKGWVDSDGDTHIEVRTLAAAEAPGSVDPLTCQTDGGGAQRLCAQFEDQSFGTEPAAFWYVRVLESPVCRWSTPDCQSLSDAERPPACDTLPETIQERAWTSPIFF